MEVAVKIAAVLDGVTAADAQFAVASGDSMFPTTGASASASNCPLGSETAPIRVYRTRLAPAYATPFFDWSLTTDLGEAHSIATAYTIGRPAMAADSFVLTPGGALTR
ncbi:MAG: hypothetical protein EPO40_02715 [Myxococcaceae bacterium]|nr:MAG: hypothetical protein EPO40_02715 [Myxococcaceae bacterium]